MPKLTNIAPFFIVEDMRNAMAYYVNKLGFALRFMGPDDEDPFFAILGRDGVSIMLKSINPAVKAAPNYTQHEWARWDAYIAVDDPDTLFKEYTAMGANFRQPLMDDEDGLRGFEVVDADGYILFFGRPNE